MAQERAARPMSGFFKFTELGDSVTGKIREAKNGSNGPFVVIESPLIRKGRKGALEKYASVAVGVSTDMASKLILPDDVGQFVAITYNDSEPTTKGSNKKIFRVLMLSASEYAKAESQANKGHASQPFKAEEKSATDGGDDPLGGDDNDEEDLPF